MVVLPPNFLDSGASIICPSSPCIHHQGTNSLTSCESSHLHQTQDVRTLVLIFFSVHGVSIKWSPNIFISKIYRIYLIITKLCKMTFAAVMCTFIHSSIHMRMSVIMTSKVCICVPWMMCMNMWSLFLLKQGF